MDSDFLIRAAFYVCTATAVIFIVEAIFLAVAGPVSRKRSVNRRLKTIDAGIAGEQTMLRLKAERGLLGKDLEVMGWLSRLRVQSGLRLTTSRLFQVLTLAVVAAALALNFFTRLPVWACVLGGLLLGVLIPIQVIRIIRSRRQARFTEQLPDSLDVIVRSLRSGHPVPTAMALVAREMADPAGTEFGLTIDEITYGLDMPQALSNLSDRVGVADLSLLVTAVSLQSTSGGNLSEVLENLSKILRDRFQLRRKVRAISAEGRYSAYGLTIMPIMIFFAIFMQNPKYYTDVWDEPIFKLTMGGLAAWSLVGDYIMFKMINFKF